MKISEKKQPSKLLVFIVLVFMVIFVVFLCSSPSLDKKEYGTIDINELYITFSKVSDLSDLQKQDIFDNTYKDKLFKSVIRADRINKASLSSKIVVLQMHDDFNCEAKVFFKNSEKDKLSRISLGNDINFVGVLVAYKYGFANCVEFNNAVILNT